MKKYLSDTKKVSPLFVLLAVISTTAMLISNIIACKVFAVGSIGVLPAAVIIFPVTYILSDVFSEVYGYEWSRRTAWISFGMNLIMVIFFSIAIALPGIDAAKSEAMSLILGNTPWALAASLAAFMVGDFMNDNVFKRMKAKDGEEGFAKRAIVSSLVGELCDSLIYIPLGMNILPTLFLGFSFMTWPQILVAIPLQAITKTAYECLIVPITCKVAKTIKAYENSLVA